MEAHRFRRHVSQARQGRRLAAVAVAALACLVRSAAADNTPGALRATAAAGVAPRCGRAGRRLQRQPACAFGRKVYLVAWSDGDRKIDAPTADIYCARVEAGTGKVLDPAGIRVCAAADLQEWPAVAFDGENFLVAWQDLRGGTDYDVYAARVSEKGTVLDPNGFAVARRPANQARPAVGFGGGNCLVVWMDARQYPVYGLYGARVSSAGKVLDPDGRALDAEDPARIAKAKPPGKSWLGDRHYWWERLASRFHPAVASDGKVCLVTHLRDVHANRTEGCALRVDPGRCEVIGEPTKLSGEPRDRVAACAVPGGWVVAFDHWLSGWTPAARLAALRLDASLTPRDTIPRRTTAANAPSLTMLMDVQKALADDGGLYHQGKGHFAFWQAAAAFNGRHVVVAMDYGWRARRNSSELGYAVVAARFDPREGRFVDSQPLALASGGTKAGTSVRRPALATGPGGETLVVYEKDAGVDRRTVEARILRFE